MSCNVCLIHQVRKQLKAMGQESGANIEPDSQTELADATMAIPGVVIAGVPGGTRMIHQICSTLYALHSNTHLQHTLPFTLFFILYTLAPFFHSIPSIHCNNSTHSHYTICALHHQFLNNFLGKQTNMVCACQLVAWTHCLQLCSGQRRRRRCVPCGRKEAAIHFCFLRTTEALQ